MRSNINKKVHLEPTVEYKNDIISIPQLFVAEQSVN